MADRPTLGPRTTPDDPAYPLLLDDVVSVRRVHDPACYICMDPEFSQMGLPLCRPCPACRKAGRGDGHIAADDSVCSACEFDEDEEVDPR